LAQDVGGEPVTVVDHERVAGRHGEDRAGDELAAAHRAGHGEVLTAAQGVGVGQVGQVDRAGARYAAAFGR
jgi:hypothetical protein